MGYSVKLQANRQRIDGEGLAPLFLLVIIDRQKMMISLSLKWPVKMVDNKAGVIIPRSKKDPDYSDYKLIIHNEVMKINEIFKVFRIEERVLTMESFKFELKNRDLRKCFIAYMDFKIRKRFSDGEISSQTYKNQNTTVNRLREFKGNLPFHGIKKDVLTSFANWLNHKKFNASGTVWSRVRDVKVYINLAQNEGIRISNDHRRYKNHESFNKIIYLEENEIRDLMRKYLSKTLNMMEQDVLRTFLFSCFTSLRISDLLRAQQGWINSVGALQFLPYKTRKFNREVEIPLSDIAKSFLKNETGLFFRNLPTTQEMNRTIKDICAEVRIRKPISFHVARHTFATHYYRQTKDVVSLQKLMGHSKIATTMVYVHVNDEDKRNGIEKMNDHFTNFNNSVRIVG